MALCNLPPPTEQECLQIPLCNHNDYNMNGSICSSNISVSSCLAGFMYVNPNDISAKPPRNIDCLDELPNSNTNPNAPCYESSYPYTRACCPGFYCPQSLYCMLPCTHKGSYCPSSDTLIYPNCGVLHTIYGHSYGHEMGCGGASQIDTICPSGYFCPNSSDIETCPASYFCRTGSIKPIKCSGFMSCPSGIEIPKISGLAIFLFSLLFLIICILALCNTMKRCIWSIFNFCYKLKYGEEFETWKLREHGKMKIATLFTDDQHINSKIHKPYDLNNYYEINEEYFQKLEDENKRDDQKTDEKSVDDDEKAQTLDFLMDVEFKNLSLTLKANNRKILDNCSGMLHCGTVNAIMGPSGAGKTSFLFTLCGKATSYGKIEGDIFINGEKKTIQDFKDIVGFVPQSDVMTAEMTVKEMLEFNAKFRLSSRVSDEYRETVVWDVLKLLKIEKIRHSLIGDDVKRGISGGQQKRVNIGCELVCQPSIIFCDEPTSGLDSTTSNEVMEVLKLIAKRGTTVLVVLHQPRYEIFKQFDNVILLAEGGKMVYMGDTEKSIKYFEQFGYSKPSMVNPSDWFMDIISDTVESVWNNNIDLVQKWRETDKNQFPMKINPDFYFMDHVIKDNAKYKPRKKLSFCNQCIMCSKRAIIILWRQKWTLVSDIIMITFTGFVLGFIIDASDINQVASNILFTVMSSSIVGCIVSLRIFGNDRIMFWRFASVGINRFSYYIGAIIASLPWIIFQPLLFLLFYWPMSMPRGDIITYYFLLLLAMFCVQGLGHLISVIVDPNKSILVAVVLVMIFNFFNGFQPTLNSLDDTIGGTISSDIAYSRWQQEALWMKEINKWPQVFAIDRSQQQQYYGWQLTDDQYMLDITIIIFIGLIFRIFTFLALIFVNRSKQC